MTQEILARLIFLLFLPLIIGYFIKGKFRNSSEISVKLIRTLTIFLTPVISLIVFWQIKLAVNLMILPLVGALLTTFAGLFGITFSRWHRLDGQQKGSYLAGAAFSNIGWSGGTLLSYIFLGQSGLALALAYTVYFILYYHSLGFWLASYYGQSATKPALKNIFTNKLVYLPLAGIVAGILFNLSKVDFPLILQPLNDNVFLPVFICGALLAVGMTLYIRNVWQCQYSRRIYFSISVIKFIITPFLGLTLAFLFHLSPLMTKVVLIMSLMPAAESSMHISRIFGLDQNLANSNYLLTTFLANFWSIPLIFLVCHFF